MKKLLLLLLLLSSAAQAVESPCYWSGTYVRCMPAGGIFLDNGRSLTLSPDTDVSHFVEFAPPAAMAANYTLIFPATNGFDGQALQLTAGALGWYTPFTSASFNNYKTTLPMKMGANAASTANINMALGNPTTVDGVDFTFGGNVLLKNQTDASENGLWYVDSSGTWTRDTTMPDNTTSAFSAIVAVGNGGTVNGDTIWYSRSNGDGNVPFVQIPATASNAPLTASRALVTSAASKLAPSATTTTQLEYLSAATGTTGTTSSSLVFSASPVLTAPTIGVATATSINKMAVTAPATSSTLAVADGKTFTVNQTMTFTGTSGTTQTFPVSSQSILGATDTQNVSNKTFGNSNAYTSKDGSFTLQNTSDVTKLAQFDLSGITTGTGRTYILPNASTTLVGQGTALGTPSSGTLTSVTGLPLTTGVTGTLPVANGGTGVTSSTGTVAVVLSTSPTLVTPVLGVATATSINSTTIPSSKTLVVTTDTLAVHAATTSAELAGVISNETGTGVLAFATTPTLTTPVISVVSTDLGGSASAYSASDQVRSGRFTAGYTAVTNNSAGVPGTNGMHWSQNGLEVTCDGYLTLTTTTGSAGTPVDTSFTLTLPVTPTSNFSSFLEAIGNGVFQPTTAQIYSPVLVFATASAKTVTLNFAATAAASGRSIYYHFMYKLN